MDINLGLYKIFASVAKAGSFSKAAQELYITQPAVSQAIKQLEDSLKTKLFIRSRHGVNLTKEGEVLYGYVQSALSLIKTGESKVERFKELVEGELRIGAGDTVSKWYLLPFVEKFHQLYPDISINVTNRTTIETIELLQNGRIDIGFVNLPYEENGIVFKEIAPVHDIFVAGDKFSYLKGRKISWDDLAENPLIMLERNSNSRLWIDDLFLQKGIILQPVVELGVHDLLADYAEIGLGIACVIREYSQKALAEKNLFEIELDTPIPARGLGACYLEEVGLSTAAQRFLQIIEGNGN